MTHSDFSARVLAERLLAWYGIHGRTLPWRAPLGVVPDAYRVWLSEIMLQQTTVASVAPYFETFLRRWPSVGDLAAADLDSVLHAWQGLGYYARARNLHACARAVAGDLDGRFPDTEEGLRALPGIGAYTAAAIAAIAFGRQAAPVDGNVVRVLARLHAVDLPMPGGRGRIDALARDLAPQTRSGDFWQAVMDLGATVCTPRAPDCGDCPWAEACAARVRGNPEDFPRRVPRAAKPTRFGIVFWAERADGAILLRRRSEQGLLGGMMEIPSTPWRERPWSLDEACAEAPVAACWRALDGLRVRHTFSHFHLELAVARGRADGGAGVAGGVWSMPDDLSAHALPTVMRKVVRAVVA